MKFKKETELAKRVVNYLQDLKWDVYQEVQLFQYGNIADIVAIQNKIVWVIECKLSFSLNLIAQATTHKTFANYISIAIPEVYKRQYKSRNIKQEILSYYGLGCLIVNPLSANYYFGVSEDCKPKFNRKASTKYYLDCLCEKHKTWAKAGNAEGLRYTPFQDTVKQFKNYINKNPGCSLKEAIESINHHYHSDSTAKGNILQWIHKGIIKGIKLNLEKGKYKLYID